jgi:hypothetical protein
VLPILQGGIYPAIRRRVNPALHGAPGRLCEGLFLPVLQGGIYPAVRGRMNPALQGAPGRLCEGLFLPVLQGGIYPAVRGRMNPALQGALGDLCESLLPETDVKQAPLISAPVSMTVPTAPLRASEQYYEIGECRRKASTRYT